VTGPGDEGIHMFLDLKRLRFFVTICDQRSMTAAARQAHVTQPVLSYHVAELEKAIGEPLLHRRADGVEPTEAGKALLAHARPIITAVSTAEQALRERRLEPGGTVSVGLLASIAPAIGPRLIRECRMLFPHIELRIFEGTSLQLRAGVLDGSFDLAINLREPGDRASLPLLFEHLYFVARRGVVDVRRDSLSLAEALQHRLLLPPKGHVVRRLVDDAASTLGLTVEIEAEIEGLSTLKALVSEAVGPTILGFGAIKNEYEVGTFVAARIVKPAIQRELILDETPKRRHPNAVEKVKGIVSAAIDQISPMKIL